MEKKNKTKRQQRRLTLRVPVLLLNPPALFLGALLRRALVVIFWVIIFFSPVSERCECDTLGSSDPVSLGSSLRFSSDSSPDILDFSDAAGSVKNSNGLTMAVTGRGTSVLLLHRRGVANLILRNQCHRGDKVTERTKISLERRMWLTEAHAEQRSRLQKRLPDVRRV